MDKTNTNNPILLLEYFEKENYKDYSKSTLAEKLEGLRMSRKDFIKSNKNEQVTIINTQILKIKEELKDRRFKTLYRPGAFVEREKINKKTLALLNTDNKLELIESYEKQLGELGYTYGFLINRIENYLCNYQEKIEVTSDRFIIKDDYNSFMAGFHGIDRRELNQAMLKNKYVKVRLYRPYEGDPNKTEYADYEWAIFLLKGTINKRLKNLQNIKDLDDINIPKIVEIKINKELFAGIWKVSKGEKLAGEYRQVKKSIVDLPLMLKKEIENIQNIYKELPEEEKKRLSLTEIKILNRVLKMQYTDKMRIMAEIIYMKYETGKAARKKDYFDISFNEIFNLNPSLRKCDKDYIFLEAQFRAIISCFMKITEMIHIETNKKEKVFRVYFN